MERSLAQLVALSTAVSIAACVGELQPSLVCSDAVGTVNGVSIDFVSDPNNCGCLGRVCPQGLRGDPHCQQGRCGLRCQAGWGDCDGNASTGCETDLQTLENCGTCGMRCSVSRGTPSCGGGACTVLSCDPGLADCDRNASNGCEVDVRSSLNHCGMCGVNCAPPHATASCSQRVCRVESCEDGYGNCDGDVTNGCESVLASSPQNCGTCGVRCASIGGSASCVGGRCQLRCESGRGDCDGRPENGCETDLNVASEHCGVCGNRCPTRPNAGFPACIGSVCSFNGCLTPFANCDGQVNNGCEVNFSNDGNNCGGCDTRCSARVANASSRICRDGRCDYAGSCDLGYGDCDGNRANGCETPLNTSSNCGYCGIGCSRSNAFTSCSSGTCRITGCYTSWQDCNGIPSDGCETNTSTNWSHCGRCNNPCLSGYSCQSSRCECTISCATGEMRYCGTNYAACCTTMYPFFCDLAGTPACWSQPTACGSARRCTSGMYAGMWRACHRDNPSCNPCP